MKTQLKQSEHMRLLADGGRAFIVYIEHGLIHITVQPKGQPTRIVIVDRDARIEK